MTSVRPAPLTTSNPNMGAPLAPPSAPQSEITIRCCTDIVADLITAHQAGESVNLNALKQSVSKRHQSKLVPRLVDIISAVPQEWREVLLPKLRAKPVRTASGVSATVEGRVGGEDGLVGVGRVADENLGGVRWDESDCGGGGNGQASQVSSYRSHREYLRVSRPAGDTFQRAAGVSGGRADGRLSGRSQLLPRWPRLRL